jgi:hypothetical protein
LSVVRVTVLHMSAFTEADDLQGATFEDTCLSGARFVRADLSGVVMRGVDLDGADLDAPWLLESGTLMVNGVDVTGYVDTELDRRFPGREQRRADNPEALRSAWAAVEAAWAATLDRASAMPEGSVEVRVEGEWSFAQTLRHLVMATDTWFRGAVLQIEHPYHPLGQPNVEYYTDGFDPSVFSADAPAYDDVLAARADRVAMVRDFLATVTPEVLTEVRGNPWNQTHSESVLACLHTILEEEWEHHRYAVRDLDAIDAGRA